MVIKDGLGLNVERWMLDKIPFRKCPKFAPSWSEGEASSFGPKHAHLIESSMSHLHPHCTRYPSGSLYHPSRPYPGSGTQYIISTNLRATLSSTPSLWAMSSSINWCSGWRSGTETMVNEFSTGRYALKAPVTINIARPTQPTTKI